MDISTLSDEEFADLCLRVGVEAQRRIRLGVEVRAAKASEERLTLAEWARESGAAPTTLRRQAAAAGVRMVAGTYTQTRAAWAALTTRRRESNG